MFEPDADTSSVRRPQSIEEAAEIWDTHNLADLEEDATLLAAEQWSLAWLSAADLPDEEWPEAPERNP